MDTLLDRDTRNSNRSWRRLKPRSFFIILHFLHLFKKVIVISSNFQPFTSALRDCGLSMDVIGLKVSDVFLGENSQIGNLNTAHAEVANVTICYHVLFSV